MDTSELIRKVRRIEIKTRGLSKHIFAGQYHSAFKGKGMAFSEVREYQFGDDIRTIDWNVTARFNNPYVKVFEEERELTVVLLIDVSGSGNFGTCNQFKRDVLTEIAAVLSFSAIQNNDKIGVIFFSDTIEKFIPPKKGKQHILLIIRELLQFKPESKKTDISQALRYLTYVIKKRSISFVLSDFIDTSFEDSLKIAAKKHDIVAIRMYDEREKNMPPIGMVRFRDAETDRMVWVDTSDENVRAAYENKWQEQSQKTDSIFMRHGIDNVTVATDDDYVKQLIALFKRR